MFECYQGKVVHLIGGINNFMGKLDTHSHPNGDGWIRIKEPCIVETVHKKNEVGEMISKLGGTQRVYGDFVDIYIPPGESMLEIRVLDESGGLYEAYMKQVNQPKIERLVVPGMKGYFNPQLPAKGN